MIDRARSISPKNAEFVNEAAYQLLLKDKYAESVKYYRQAMKIDESSVQVGDVFWFTRDWRHESVGLAWYRGIRVNPLQTDTNSCLIIQKVSLPFVAPIYIVPAVMLPC